MAKPILFHDIDGVLLGDFENEYQLRPHVDVWLRWAHEHFDVIWLTAWGREKVHQLLVDQLHLEQYTPIKYAEWTNYASKGVWLEEAKPRLRGRTLIWIDDNPEDLEGVEVVRVEPTGRDALITLYQNLCSLVLAHGQKSLDITC